MSEHLSGLILKDAFISYGRKESSGFAKKLQKRFKKESMYAWFDATDIPAAVDWQQRIYKGIDEAHNFIFIISPYAVNSKYCFKEIKYAVKRNKRIIPLLHIKPSDEEVKKTHPIISEINWIPFIEDEKFEESFDVLMQAIRKEEQYVKQHTDILLRAKSWEQQGYLNSTLLHSQERESAERWLKRKFKPEEGVCNASDLHAEYICESTKNANNFMTDVFFHSVNSTGISDYLHNELHKEGITTWKLSQDSGKESKINSVRRGIQRTSTVLYFISPQEMKDELRQLELLRAQDFNKRIIPIIIASTKPTEFPVELKDLPAFDFTELNENRIKNQITNLIRTLRDDEEYFRLHRNFLVQAIKWKEQDENQSTLLQGARLQEAEDWLNQAKRRKVYPSTQLHEEYINASLKRGYEINSEVFICYSRVDSDFVRKLNDELQIMGRTTWLDTESIAPGRDFETEIKSGIESSDSVIFVISPDSVVSENCKWELTYARSFNKRLINVYLRNPEQEALPKEVEKIQWIDFQKHHRDFHKPLSELIRTIDNQRDHVREQTIWLKAAQKWEKFGKNYDRLLKGGDYLDAEQWLTKTKKNKQMQQPTPLIEEFINASKSAIDNSERKKQRSRRFLISALAFVTIFSIISVILGLYAFYQREKLRERAKVIEQQKAELLQKTQQLQETIDAVQKAETELRNRNDEISRLQQQRDSAASRANSTKERIEIIQQYNVDILDQKDKIEREKIKVQQKAKKAQAELEQIQKTQTKTPIVTEVETFVTDVPFFDGRGKDYQNGKWGYINKKGKVVIKHQFDRVTDFSNGVALVWKDGHQVFIDVKGKPKSDWLDDIDPFSDGLAEVKKGREKSFINTRGEIISKWFEDAYPFRHGRAKVKLNGKWGYINKKGDIVISPVFTNAFGFRKRKKEGISAKVTKDGVSYLIDKNGRRVGIVSRSFVIEADDE